MPKVTGGYLSFDIASGGGDPSYGIPEGGHVSPPIAYPPPGIWPPPNHLWPPTPLPPDYPMPPGSIWPPVGHPGGGPIHPGHPGHRPPGSEHPGGGPVHPPSGNQPGQPLPSNKFLVAIVSVTAAGGIQVVGYTVVDPSLNPGMDLPPSVDNTLPSGGGGHVDNTLPTPQPKTK